MHDRHQAPGPAGPPARRRLRASRWARGQLATLLVAVLVGLAGCGHPAPSPTTSRPAPPTATVATSGTTGVTTRGPEPSGSASASSESSAAGSPVTSTAGTGPATTGSAVTATSMPAGSAVPFRTVSPGSAHGRRIGVIGPAASDPFSSAVVDSVVGQLTVAGAAVTRCDPGEDASLVLDCARRLSTQRVDGWIVVQAGNLGDALCAAGPAGVPLISVGAAPLACETGWVGTDDRQAGALVGGALGRAAAKSGHCATARLVVVTDSTEDPMSSTRVTGIRQGFTAQCPGVDTAPTVIDAGTQDRGFAALRATLDATPAAGLVLVAAVNDAAALGVVAAVPEDRADRVALAAVGGDPRARCSLPVTRFWIGDAALFPDRYGEVAVPALLDALDGEAVPPAMYVVPTFLTATTVSTYYPDDRCPAA